MEASVPTVLTLWSDGEIVLSRHAQDGKRRATLSLAAASEDPLPPILARLEREYALRADLDRSWAAVPLDLLRRDRKPTLVLDDPGGEVLVNLVGRPLELTSFLRVAIALAAAVGALHARGIVHKDIKPAHILADSKTGSVWLTGFGLASRLRRERQAADPPELIAGTLPYMSPEQTGRMNRSVDSRSDLYAVGVTLYELFTGSLPFSASEPIEWIHCHIARQPSPLVKRRADVPEPLADIIMRLLAKNAEDRYQTASGLEADLRHCLAEWESTGRIESFQLGTRDVPNRLRVTEKLYGRGRATESLRAAFDRVVEDGTSELVLVRGHSGVGKTAVVDELYQHLATSRAFLGTGKFDQNRHDTPYATIADTFRGIIHDLLAKSDKELQRWRNALGEALSPNGQLLVNLVPELALVIGKQPPVPDLSPSDAQHRFHRVFRRWLAVFADARHPLVLFFDDLQSADPGTLQLLQHLVGHSEVRHVLWIGAYRDNEVAADHPLTRTLAAICGAGPRVTDLALEPLQPADVSQLVADALRTAQDTSEPLAETLYAKTDGNPLFLLQLLTTLVDDNLLLRDPATATWHWNDTRIRSATFADNVVDLVIAKIGALPTLTQEFLKTLACLGHAAQASTLSIAAETTEDATHAAMWDAVQAGLVHFREGAYLFLHDRIQEAAYDLIPAEQQSAAHLRIGRRLAAATPSGQVGEAVFEIVSQFNRGTMLATTREERRRIADLNLIAGKRAKAATALVSALAHFALGEALLDEDRWERDYELAFALALARAECEFFTGHLAASDERFAALSQHVGNLVDRAAVTCLRAQLYASVSQYARAIDVCLDYLGLVGITLVPHPTDDDVERELGHVWEQLGDRGIADVIDLPLMSDPTLCATMNVFADLLRPALATDQRLFDVTLARAASTSLEHGHSDGAAWAYLVLGVTLLTRHGQIEKGIQFGQLALDLVEKSGFDRFRGRVQFMHSQSILPLVQHLRAARAIAASAEKAMEVTDPTWSAIVSQSDVLCLLACGDPLPDAQQKAEDILARGGPARLVHDPVSAQRGFIRTLRGLTHEFGSFDDEQFDEGQVKSRLEGDLTGTVAARYWIYKLQARYYCGDCASAVAAAQRARVHLGATLATVDHAEYHLYAALAALALCHGGAAADVAEYLDAAHAHQVQLATWAVHCRDNFANRAALVAAEIARVEGRDLEAMRHYEEAIHASRQYGFIHLEGLAFELAATFWEARRFDVFSATYRLSARACYLRWGADGKVRQLDRRYPYLSASQTSTRIVDTTGGLVERLDIDAMVKASQALSSEIVLDELVEKLVRIAVENAGAQRGLLILLVDGVAQVEVEATTSQDGVEVRGRRTAVTPSELPESVLLYVLRTRETIIVDDASVRNPYSEDSYIQLRRAKSILCLPIVKQDSLAGALYLENTLTARVFTPDRVALLQVLASQAAISLENARLYGDVQRENSDRKRAEEDRRRAHFRLAAENKLLEMIAKGKALPLILDAICGLAESVLRGSLASILLLDSSGERLWQAAGPSLPREYLEAIDGTAVTATAGPCAMAALQKQPAGASDLETSSFSQDFRMLAAKYGLRSCWSSPILSLDGRLLGTFAIYFREVNSPTPEQFNLIEEVINLSSIAVERIQSEEALRRSEMYLATAQRLSLTGSFGWHLPSGYLIWSDETFRVFEYERSVKPSFELARRRVHPEDVQLLDEVAARARSTGQDFEFEHRLLMPDGRIKHLHVVAHALHDESGGVIEYVGAVSDVSRIKAEEERLRAAIEEREGLLGDLAAENVERRKAEERLEQRLAFERLISDLSADIAESVADSLDTRISSWLKRVALFLDVDRAVFFEYSVETDRFRTTAFWCSPNQLPPPSTIDGTTVPSAIAHLRLNEPFRYETTAEMPETSRWIFDRVGIRSVLGVPASIGGVGLGCLVLGAVREERRWPDDLVRRLRVIADILGNAVARKQAERDRKIQRELAQALEFRDLVIGIVGHDLKSPLSAASALTQLITRHEGLPEVVLRRVAAVGSSIERMNDLIRTLLDFTESRFKGAMTITRTKTDLARICARVVGELLAENAGRTIFQRCEGTTEGDWDPVRMEQVVSNLLSNALKHGDPIEPVTVELRAEDTDVVLEVKNRGGPIPPDVLAKLFEPFRRGPTTEPGGLGLGLYIVRQIALAHGGSVTAESSAQRGTVFTVRVPQHAAQPTNVSLPAASSVQ